MEKTYSPSLKYKPLSHGVELAKQAIRDRREGKIKSLLTSKKKLNSLLMNGVDWNRILSIAALSGAGKSLALEELKRDFINLNKDQKFYILSFDFEMLIEDQLARGLSARTGKGVKEIYSAEAPLSDEDLEQINSALDERTQDPVFYVDNAGTVEEIISTIWDFAARHCDTETGLVVTLDHTLLTKGKFSDGEKATIDNLMTSFVDLKKSFAAKGMRIIIIVLSQLNRDIEKPERTQNFYLHYPTRNDIFAASSVFMCSDYVIIIHRPSAIGIRDRYGPPFQGHPNGLPVKCPTDESRSMVYWHLLKERFGETKIIATVENYKNGRLEEYD